MSSLASSLTSSSMTSPSPSSSTDSSSLQLDQHDCLEHSSSVNTKCSICSATYTLPKVLSCFHTFCQPCLEKLVGSSTDKAVCPECQESTKLGPQSVNGLLTDFAMNNMLESSALDAPCLQCTGCKSKESNAVARCFDCANFLCPNCVMAHQFMHCFEGHRVLTLGELQNNQNNLKHDKPISCQRHKSEVLRMFCKTCNVPICIDCTKLDHAKPHHDYEFITDTAQRHVTQVTQLVEDGRNKGNELRSVLENVEHMTTRLQVQYHKAQNEIQETYQFYRSMIEERKQESMKELESLFTTKQATLSSTTVKIQDVVDRLYQGCDFIERLLKHASNTEVLMFRKMLESRLHPSLSYTPDLNGQNGQDFEFVSNFQAIQVGVRNTFGYIRQAEGFPNPMMPAVAKQAPIGHRPRNGHIDNIPMHHNGLPNGLQNGMNGHANLFDHSNILMSQSKWNGSSNLTPFPTNDLHSSFEKIDGIPPSINPYEKWSSGGLDVFHNGLDTPHIPNGDHFPGYDPVGTELASKLINATMFPPRSQIKRQKMIYHCKFGEFGVLEGQFTEPSGVAVNAQNDIIVADTNNHRIQIFDREGRFKFQFGECGKRDGQLLYPNRVAVNKATGDIIVTERSPTHQIQIYNQYGQFVRKFGANILQHPRGVTVDCKGRIIIVECKVMRVLIFSQSGEVLQKFGCSKHLEFPNGVVVNDRQEIFISDNRAHCVKVFNYDGIYLRQIGGEGITNYPIGVGINHAGEVLIADNHNNFNLTIFTQEGQLMSALESKVKHAQCFDVALLDDGSVVLASKDYRLYIYRYIQIPNMGM